MHVMHQTQAYTPNKNADHDQAHLKKAVLQIALENGGEGVVLVKFLRCIGEDVENVLSFAKSGR
jgi:hypothetical protein